MADSVALAASVPPSRVARGGADGRQRLLFRQHGDHDPFWAIMNMPMAKAIALSYPMPLFVAIGAIFALGEGHAHGAGARWPPASSACC